MAPSPPPSAPISCTSVTEPCAFVYLLRCADDSLYCGWTVDVERRLTAHAAGRASRYTASRLPVELAASWELDDPSAAPPVGLHPTNGGLEVRCCIQLSYRGPPGSLRAAPAQITNLGGSR